MGLASLIINSPIGNKIMELGSKFIVDKDKKIEYENQTKQLIIENEKELEKLAIQELRIKTDLKMEVIHNIPNFAIWYVLLFVIVFNFILPSTISYIARLFFYDAIINQGKDMTQIMLFLKPPTIELPSEYWGMMGSIYGINKIKRGFNRHNDRKLQENLKKVVDNN